MHKIIGYSRTMGAKESYGEKLSEIKAVIRNLNRQGYDIMDLVRVERVRLDPNSEAAKVLAAFLSID